MNKTETIGQIVKENKGFLKTSDILENNISKVTMAKYIKEYGMERVAHGVYISKDTWVDDYYILFLRNSRIVFSYESALYLHGLMDREPSRIIVTVPQNYNSTHISVQGIKVIHIKHDWYDIGITMIKTGFGNKVPVYDRERTICDIIRKKDDIEIQTFQTAIKEYMSSKGKNLGNLINYAKRLGVEKEVRFYTEVML